MKFVSEGGAFDTETARSLVLRYGWNTTCFQILNPGIQRVFSETGNAVIGAMTNHRVHVVAGAPVCPESDLEETMDSYAAAAERRGEKVCYFAAEDRVLKASRQLKGYSEVTLGAQPVWEPNNWLERNEGKSSLRYQLQRAKNKGVTVTEVAPEAAAEDPAFQAILEQWLQTRGFPPMHFLVEPFTLSSLRGRRLFVAQLDGSPVAFLVLSPIPERNGYLTEQFVRGFEAPNGTIELLLFEGVKAISKDGADMVTMGIVPLSQKGRVGDASNPFWLRVLLHWVRAHGRRFYNFNGLEHFKDKLAPDYWEPIYAISNEPAFGPKTLLAIATAFCGGSPAKATTTALYKAARQEVQWLTQRTPRKR